MSLDDEELLPERKTPKEAEATTSVRLPKSMLQRIDEICEAEGGISRTALLKSFIAACVRSYDKRKGKRRDK